ncbi:MAG: site-2 protease family protein [Thermoplasmataceae archaeon]
MISGLEIAIFLIFAWIVIILYLKERIGRTKHFSTLGPALMIKTTKNRGVLDGVAKRFPGLLFGKLSVVLSFITLVFAIFFIVYETVLISSVRIVSAPSPALYLALPGINPAIPIVYGGIALVVSVVVHEFMHGVVARRQNMKVNSVGALVFIVPLGAFVEPDEQEMINADPVVRRRIVAAGPGINIVIAILSILVLLFLLMPSVHVVSNGMYVEQISPMAVVQNTNVPTGSLLTAYGNYNGSSVNNLTTQSHIYPGTLQKASFVYNGNKQTTHMRAGVDIVDTIPGYPAANYTNLTGSIILSVNNQTVYNQNNLSSILDGIAPHKEVTLSVLYFNKTTQLATPYTISMISVSKYSYYQSNDPSGNSNSFKNQSFIGIETTYLGISGAPISDVATSIFGGTILTGGLTGSIYAIALPFLGLSPVPVYLQTLFVTPFMPALFWGMMNMVYWFFWINFLLGLSNILPISVFDGSQFLRDTLTIWGRRKRLGFLKNERNVRMIINTMSFIIIMILVYEIVLPYLR